MCQCQRTVAELKVVAVVGIEEEVEEEADAEEPVMAETGEKRVALGWRVRRRAVAIGYRRPFDEEDPWRGRNLLEPGDSF